ncbi:DUF1003 domain-containing protein [Bradyrhizobium sp. LA7.1]
MDLYHRPEGHAAPVIMMSQNRQQDIRREIAENDYRTT